MQFMKPQNGNSGGNLQNVIRKNLQKVEQKENVLSKRTDHALPESFTEYQPDRLLQLFTNHFKQNYGAECIAALHHNKRKTNYHIHLIFAERKLLDEPIIKIASRNMFYDEHGKHVRTKKEILGEDGEIREGCHIVKKGEVYEKKLFTAKDERFKSNSFLDEVKHSYTDLINIYVRRENEGSCRYLSVVVCILQQRKLERTIQKHMR